MRLMKEKETEELLMDLRHGVKMFSSYIEDIENAGEDMGSLFWSIADLESELKYVCKLAKKYRLKMLKRGHVVT